MKKIVEQSDLIFEELLKFADDLVYLGPPILDDRLELFERQIGFTLPFDFKYILKRHNGVSLHGTEIYGIDKTLRGSSLDEVYGYEHYIVENAMPDFFLPFSPDGKGNHYCLNLSELSDNSCPVVFWQHDFHYSDLSEVETCNTSLIDWINEVMIGWTSEDFDYDGNEKG